ncbi:SH3 domain-containing protein [Thalassococcus sp. BH17M4-6]|uniref:SH3 domain-containing protein n=1 Tax=Thalassococcus sp. BH17M4-6 TaxID=3413148 RepID=UPI003BBE02F8
MTRFIILSFAFMGWGFYEMSGGADFEPGSYTTAKADPADDAEPAPEAIVARADTSSAPLTTVALTRDTADDTAPKLDVTLARADQRVIEPASEPETDAPVDAEKLAALVAEGISEAETTADLAVGVEDVSAPEETAVLFSMDDLNRTAPAGRSDLREVSGSRVNLRDGPGTSYGVVTQLERGDDVVVLADTGDGWLKLQVVDSNRIGWMADFLVTASAE